MSAIDYEPHDENDEFPLVPADLLRALELRFPDRLPDSLDCSDRALWASVGAARVVRFLREMHTRIPIR